MISGHTELSAAFSPMDLLKLLETARTKFSWNYLLSQALRRYNARNWFPSANLIYSPMHTHYNSVFNWPVSRVHGGWIQTVGFAGRPMPNAVLKELSGCKGWVLKGTERGIWLFRQTLLNDLKPCRSTESILKTGKSIFPTGTATEPCGHLVKYTSSFLIHRRVYKWLWCTVKKDVAEAMRAYNERNSDSKEWKGSIAVIGSTEILNSWYTYHNYMFKFKWHESMPGISHLRLIPGSTVTVVLEISKSSVLRVPVQFHNITWYFTKQGVWKPRSYMPECVQLKQSIFPHSSSVSYSLSHRTGKIQFSGALTNILVK